MTLRQGNVHFPLSLFLDFVKAGWLGVSLFLVLSGFCLYFPLVQRNTINEINLDIKAFAKRRAWRILPPYYAAFSSCALLYVLFLNYKSFHAWFYDMLSGPSGIVLHVFMLFNIDPISVSDISGSFWSIALECQLYVLFPLFVWSYRRYGIKPTLSAAFLVSLAWQIMCYHKLGFATVWTPIYSVYYHALPARCFEFALGMAAASFCARPRPKQSRIAIAILAALTIPALWFVLTVSRFAPLIDQIWGVIFAAVLILLSRIPDTVFDRNAVGRFFVWIGTISYSIYLVHMPLILILSPATMHIHSYSLAALVRFPFLILLGYGFHLAAERPFMRMSKKPKQSLAEAAAFNPAP
jgi:peptidoglycan/LPS O-acetylase OafA/YrhL